MGAVPGAGVMPGPGAAFREREQPAWEWEQEEGEGAGGAEKISRLLCLPSCHFSHAGPAGCGGIAALAVLAAPELAHMSPAALSPSLHASGMS